MKLLQVRRQAVLGRILLFTLVTLHLPLTGILSLLSWGANMYLLSIAFAPLTILVDLQIFCQGLLQPFHLFQLLGPKFYQGPSCNFTQLFLGEKARCKNIVNLMKGTVLILHVIAKGCWVLVLVVNSSSTEDTTQGPFSFLGV